MARADVGTEIFKAALNALCLAERIGGGEAGKRLIAGEVCRESAQHSSEQQTNRFGKTPQGMKLREP